jgi:antitoxin component HigA of HigAB toxin-antitoxin module
MDIRPIRTDEDHRAALAEIEACWGAPEGSEARKIPADLLVRPYAIESAA